MFNNEALHQRHGPCPVQTATLSLRGNVVRLQSRTDGTFAGEAEPLADIRTLAEYAEHRQKLSE